MVILGKRFMWTNPLILYQSDKMTMCIILKGPYGILSNLPVLGTLDSIKPFWLKWFQKTIAYVERSTWGLRSSC